MWSNKKKLKIKKAENRRKIKVESKVYGFFLELRLETQKTELSQKSEVFCTEI